MNDGMRAQMADQIDPAVRIISNRSFQRSFPRQERLLKPLGGYTGYSAEWRELAEVITRVNTSNASFIRSGSPPSFFFIKTFSPPSLSHHISPRIDQSLSDLV